ncbi:hypothetical protein [Endozoicomonas arenosclerae]|uniref:hypothetical protein n=1 Tax=Endozoicomonas arenosclerae TaxID=1633495 RepID=UPI000784B664|nr:hypothetical protein [Endozoicomonas arenosclerae]
MKPIRFLLCPLYLSLIFCLVFASASYASHLDNIQSKLQKAGFNEQGKKVEEFKSRFPGLVLVINRWLPERISPEVEALLANLVVYLVNVDSEHGHLSNHSSLLEKIAQEQLVAVEGERDSKKLSRMTPAEILFELFFVIESYRLSLLSPSDKPDGEAFKVALESFLLERPYSRAPYIEVEQELSLEQLIKHFNVLSLLMMLTGSGRSSANAQLIMGAIKSLTVSQQRLLSQRILELIILRGHSLHAFQRWLESQLEGGRSSGEIFSQLLDNDGSVEGFESTLEKFIPDLRTESLGARTYIPPSVMNDPAAYSRYKRVQHSDQWPVTDAESQVRTRIIELGRERDARIRDSEKEVPDWSAPKVPKSNRELMDDIMETLKLLESAEVKGDAEKLHSELLRHLDRLDQAYPSKQKFKEKIEAAKTSEAKQRFRDQQHAYMAQKEREKQILRELAAKSDYEQTLLRVKLTALQLQRKRVWRCMRVIFRPLLKI